MKIAVIPIDNRPICYDLVKDILSVDKNIELFMPDIEYLAGLKKSANINKIFEFLENLCNTDYLILSLDTVAYGGLIQSRRVEDDIFIIKKRLEKFKKIIKNKAKHILAFSSIMRISNNNINEEEKEYWNVWGKKIFDWSREFDKIGVFRSSDIPNEILEDYLNTRKRNFEINKMYVSWADEGFFDTLVLSKDDCSEYGLNIREARILKELSKDTKNVFIKTGADEIPLSLISRAISLENKVKIEPLFSKENSKNLISKYEDISIEECVLSQLDLANVESGKDITMIINNFENSQGDWVLGDKINKITETIDFPSSPYFIADVNNANGGDTNLIKQLFLKGSNDFFGYSGYNTSANTIGSSILIAIIKYNALKNNSYNDTAFKKLQFIRLLDDWVYQTISRKFIRESAPDFENALKNKRSELNKHSLEISQFLNFYPKKITYSLPWNRSFEIRIKAQ